MIDRKSLIGIIARLAEFSYSRSSGKGGQNVNKLNTKARAALSLDDLAFLSPEEAARLKVRLASRLAGGGTLSVQVQDERTQARNSVIAAARLADLIMAALRVRKKRRPTRPPAAARAERLASKRRKTVKKISRRSPPAEE